MTGHTAFSSGQPSCVALTDGVGAAGKMGTLVRLKLISVVRLALMPRPPPVDVTLGEVALASKQLDWAVRKAGKRRQVKRRKTTKQRMTSERNTEKTRGSTTEEDETTKKASENNERDQSRAMSSRRS